MLVLTSTRAIRHATTTCAKSVPSERLSHYAVLLEPEPIAWLFLTHPGDTLVLLEQLRGRAFEDPEFVRRDGGWFEAVFVLSDAGFGHVVFVPDQPEIDPALLAVCRAHLT